MNVTTAYLHTDVDTELYMKQPEGFEKQGNQREELVCKLKKSLYGLKQAGHNWNKEIDQWLKKNKMKAADADPCLYIFQGENPQDFLALALYVDDILIIDNNTKIREDLTKKMKQKFKIVNLGRANWILETRITYTQRLEASRLTRRSTFKKF